MMLAPYLFFDGHCEAAIDFYKIALGAEVEALMRFRDAPPQDGPSRLPPGSEDKIMHACLKIGSAQFMVSDGMCTGDGKPRFDGFSLSLTVPDVPTAERLFGALAADGEVRQPLGQTFFAPSFGMVADKFGVGWIVVAQA